MSDRSNKGAPHHGTSNAKKDPSGNTAPHNSDNAKDTDTTRDSQLRDSSDVSASTPYMPQSGKLAGKVNHPPHQQDQRVDADDADPEKHRREDVAGSSRWIPQAGKPTGTSSL